ncbi:MAG: DUF3040 domain-containing protein [Mycobacterium sp.]|jgi:uncharacterized membrane protein|nr:DUF3040 domain-containing protein [Mycobacterium sp.]
MPLSEHEQRMLDQIESALYAEDPKFASSVRGGTLRATSARRRLKGVTLFVVGLAMLIAGVPFYAQNHAFIIVSIIGFVVMFAGAVVAVTGPRSTGKDQSAPTKGGVTPIKKAKGSGGSFTSRMEDRFRRRFDE